MALWLTAPWGHYTKEDQALEDLSADLKLICHHLWTPTQLGDYFSFNSSIILGPLSSTHSISQYKDKGRVIKSWMPWRGWQIEPLHEEKCIVIATKWTTPASAAGSKNTSWQTRSGQIFSDAHTQNTHAEMCPEHMKRGPLRWVTGEALAAPQPHWFIHQPAPV